MELWVWLVDVEVVFQWLDVDCDGVIIFQEFVCGFFGFFCGGWCWDWGFLDFVFVVFEVGLEIYDSEEDEGDEDVVVVLVILCGLVSFGWVWQDFQV